MAHFVCVLLKFSFLWVGHVCVCEWKYNDPVSAMLPVSCRTSQGQITHFLHLCFKFTVTKGKDVHSLVIIVIGWRNMTCGFDSAHCLSPSCCETGHVLHADWVTPWSSSSSLWYRIIFASNGWMEILDLTCQTYWLSTVFTDEHHLNYTCVTGTKKSLFNTSSSYCWIYWQRMSMREKYLMHSPFRILNPQIIGIMKLLITDV